MKKFRVLGFMGMMSLMVLAGCGDQDKTMESETIDTQTSTSESVAQVDFSDEDLYIVAYAENVALNDPKASLYEVFQTIEGQPNLIRLAQGQNNTYIGEEEDTDQDTLATYVAIEDDTVSTTHIKGTRTLENKQYQKEALEQKYSAYLDQIHMLEKRANHNADIAVDRAMADNQKRIRAYLKNVEGYSQEDLDAIQLQFHFEGDVIYTPILEKNGTKKQIGKFKIVDGSNDLQKMDSREGVWKTVTESDTPIVSAQADTALLGEPSSSSSNSSTTATYTSPVIDGDPENASIDTTDLTTEQVKEWIGNYLIKAKTTSEDVIKNKTVYLFSKDEEGNLKINARGDNPDGTISSSLGFFRIDGQGELQLWQTNATWKTISKIPILTK